MWDFSTEPVTQERLDWADAFVRSTIEPLEALIAGHAERARHTHRHVVPELQQQVKDQGLWAWHLPPQHGGMGSTQVNLALLNESVGRSRLAPLVFGIQGADSGNMEVLARFGSDDLQRRYLEPLVAGRIRSCFAATEPQGGSDPQVFATTAVLDGDEWVVDGEKWFASGAAHAAFFLVLAVTEPHATRRERMSMLLIDRDAPGVELVRLLDVPLHGGNHGYVRFRQVRVPADNLLGPRGGAFKVLQARMGPARIQMAMRVSGMLLRSFEMMCERVNSRTTQGSLLADKQLVQGMVAETWLDIEQYRLLVMRTAWRLDQGGDYSRLRADISGLKALLPEVLHRVVRRTIQIHGSLGLTTELPLLEMLMSSLVRGIGDGPTEVHKVTLARQLTRRHAPAADAFPSYHLPKLAERGAERFPDVAAISSTASDPPAWLPDL